MPTYNQSHFIRRAINSVLVQTYPCWELIIVNDGCKDDTEEYVLDFLENPQIIYLKNKTNQGIGYSINRGLAIAKYELIAYLPSDDYFYKDHLLIHYKEYSMNQNLILTFTKAYSRIEDSFMNQNHINAQRCEIGNLCYNTPLQLVQTVHRNIPEKWSTENISSKDFFKMYWEKLVTLGRFKPINKLSCCWSIHEPITKADINFQEESHLMVSIVECQEDVNVYDIKPSRNESMKILLVGELSHNPDRILALKNAGCELFGLWTNKPLWSNIGPITGITDLSLNEWRSEIKRIKPDIIYGLLNYMSVPLAHEILMKNREIPFVWHFKEGPYICQYRNMWNKLIDLYRFSDGQIYINNECKAWFKQYVPCFNEETTLILDGDLPSGKIINNKFAPKLSQIDGEVHILNSGRLIGLSLNDVNFLCEHKMHIHSYGFKSALVSYAHHLNPEYFHIHGYCTSENWVTEFSKYDAGLLHCFYSKNHNELVRASWDDLNIPAKISTFAIAGLPMIQRNNSEHIVATQRITENLHCGVTFDNLEDLCFRLKNTATMIELTSNIIKQRRFFVFDTYVSTLIDFFTKIISMKVAY